MKTRTIISTILSLFTMVLLPVLTVTAVLGADAIGLMFLYTMALNPLVSIVIGILSGWDEKIQWYLPLANAIVYLIASIVIMGFSVSWLLGAIVYFGLGALSAFVTSKIKKRKADK